jgi:hypothetical protein
VHAEDVSDRRSDQIGMGDWGEIHEDHALGEIMGQVRGDRKCEPGLADTARPGQRQQPNLRTA